MTSLPSLRSLDLAQGARIWLAAEAADMIPSLWTMDLWTMDLWTSLRSYRV